jgi:mannose-6-phosphate isomerase-like protein (cupin superfamily)
MPFVQPDRLPLREPRPGFRGRFFHSDHMTFAYYSIQQGGWVHAHHHENEEVWHVLEGEVEMTVGGEQRLVRGGEAAVVPAGVEHSATATRPCRVIVVDFPVRTEVAGVDIG